jgi:Phage capsid family
MGKEGLPFVLDRGAKSREYAISISRAISVMGRAALAGRYAKELVAGVEDRQAREIIERGAVVPTNTSNTTTLRQTTIDTLAAVMGPTSVAGQLLPKMQNLTLEGVYGISLPDVLADPDAAAWIAEGDPYPVKQFTIDAGKTLTKRKLGMILTAARELFEYADGEQVIGDLIRRSYSLSFEKFLFGTDVGSASQPAGLLAGISAETKTGLASDTTATDAMVKDLSLLASKVLAIANDPHFVTGPAAYTAIKMRQPLFPFPLMASTAVDDAAVICLSPSCVAIAGGLDPPTISVSRKTTLHMADDPAPLTTQGTPNVAAYPVRSLAQTDCVAIKLRCELDWALRSATALAWVNDIVWSK